MKIVFFNRFFFPDASATSQILSDLAFHLAASGAEVHVVTSKLAAANAAEEAIRGVHVHRVTKAIEGPHGLFQRAYAYLRYYLGARRAAATLLQAGDIAVIKTDPPMLSAIVGPVAGRRGARIVAWMQDIFPEVAHEYGVPFMGRPFGSWLRRIRDRSLVAADRVVAIGERMAARLAAEGVPVERLRVIHNWADGEAIRPLPRENNPLRVRWGLGHAFVAAYSGNLGRVHEFDTLLSAAAMLKGDGSIRFLFIGRGPRLAEVQNRVRRDELDNVFFQPHQERERLAESLAVADVHLSVLLPRFDSLVLPSKLYGIMAAARPVIFIGDPRGESASLIRDAGCGLVIESGDGAALAAALARLRDSPAERESMGRNGRQAFETRYDMSIALAEWRETLRELGPPARLAKTGLAQ